MRIITDGRTLRHLAKKYNFGYDKEYKYITDNASDWTVYENLKKDGYILKYFDGCFCPYLFKKEE